MVPHIPALRLGKPYASLDKTAVKNCRTGQPLAELSQVNAGLLRKDLAQIGESRAALKALSCERLLGICAKAGELFLNASLPLGAQGQFQTPEQYTKILSATSGLPF